MLCWNDAARQSLRLLTANDAERLLSIPVSLLLHAEVGLSDPSFGAAFHALRAEAGADVDERFLLVLVVLVERLKGQQSRWAPYINHLPAEYGAPMLFGDSNAGAAK